MCDFTGPSFGAGYVDGICIAGYMWDLDSDDGTGHLSRGGEIPCMQCNLVAYLKYLAEDFESEGIGDTSSPAANWQHCLGVLHEQHGPALIEALIPLGERSFASLPTDRSTIRSRRDYDAECEMPLALWPWKIPQWSHHAFRRLERAISREGRPHE